MSFSTIDGDSGSPLWRLFHQDEPPEYYLYIAVGIMDHESGYFARISDAFEDWDNATIWTQ